jgi:hypothetical protein
MFFFETLAFVIVFPLCWWLGGWMARRDRVPPPVPSDDAGAEVIDLAAWRRRRDARLAREQQRRAGGRR